DRRKIRQRGDPRPRGRRPLGSPIKPHAPAPASRCPRGSHTLRIRTGGRRM
ncbi:MAG: hypothetical protein AVDCRST_MAG03-397, partial [uncultured Rubrobacteraceae bacterium]